MALLLRSPTGRHLPTRELHSIVQNYSLQSNRKLEEGEDHPDRDAQFRHINEWVKRALAAGEPVISVDTKKKELVGNYANSGQQWRVAKQPERVQGHDYSGPSNPSTCPEHIPTASSTWGATPGL
jgi:hypothetical protein